MTENKLPGRPLKFMNPAKLQRKIDAYFRSCFDYQRDKNGSRIRDTAHEKDSQDTPVYVMKQVKPFTVSGLAVFLDTDRATLMKYQKGDFLPENMSEEEKAQYFNTIKRAKERIYSFTEEQLFNPGTATGAIFSLKNNWSDDWEDVAKIDEKKEVTVITKNYRELEPDEDKPEPIEAEIVQPKELEDGNSPSV